MATSEVPKPSQKCMLPDVAPPPHRSSSGATKSSRFLSVLPALCCAFMLYSSFTAIVDSHGDPATVFFVVSSLVILGLLYLSMRQFERGVAEKEGAKRDRLKSSGERQSPKTRQVQTRHAAGRVFFSCGDIYTSDAKKNWPSTPKKFSIFFSLLPAASCAVMLYSSVTAIVDSHGDPSTVFFVVSSLSILGLLYLAMREFERAVAVKDDQKRDHPLKTAIWSLAVLLNILFGYRVTYVLQSPIVTGIVWGIAAVTSLVGVYLLFFLPAPPLTTNKEDTQRGCLKMSIWPLAMDLNLLFSYVVTSVLQSPFMTGVIRGIAAVTSSSRKGAPLWILRVIITGLGFIAATAESTQIPIEASNATDIHPQVLSSPFIALVVCLVIASLFFILALVYMIKKLETNPDFFMRDRFNLKVAKCLITVFLSVTFGCLCLTSTGDGSEISSSSSSLYRDILNVFFLCGCSVSILRVSSLATVEFQRTVITKITIFSLPMLLTSLCTYRASSVLQVGVLTAAAWTFVVLSWSVSSNNNQPGN